MNVSPTTFIDSSFTHENLNEMYRKGNYAEVEASVDKPS